MPTVLSRYAIDRIHLSFSYCQSSQTYVYYQLQKGFYWTCMSSNSFSVLLPSCTYTNYYKEYAKCLDIIQQFDSGLQCFHLPAAKCSQETLFHLILCGGKLKCHTRVGLAKAQRACGAMDNASDYGSEDARFESWQARRFLLLLGTSILHGCWTCLAKRRKNKRKDAIMKIWPISTWLLLTGKPTSALASQPSVIEKSCQPSEISAIQLWKLLQKQENYCGTEWKAAKQWNIGQEIDWRIRASIPVPRAC